MRTLVLLRHGESTWNLENRFTGWTDVGLTDTGVQQARDARYSLLRGYFHGADDDTVEELDQTRLLSVTLPPTSSGRTLVEHALADSGVTVVSLRRASGAVLQPHETMALAPGDTLVLSGSPETLARAEAALLAPG